MHGLLGFSNLLPVWVVFCNVPQTSHLDTQGSQWCTVSKTDPEQLGSLPKRTTLGLQAVEVCLCPRGKVAVSYLIEITFTA